MDTVRKAEVIGSVHDDVCTHRSRATVQNRLAQKPGFYAESACTRQARWIFRLLSVTGLYVSSASTRDFTVYTHNKKGGNINTPTACQQKSINIGDILQYAINCAHIGLLITVEQEIFVNEYFHYILEMTFHLNYIFVF